MSSKKSVILGGLMIVCLMLALIGVGFKAGTQIGQVKLCDTMGGTLAIDKINDKIICANSSIFEGNGYNIEYSVDYEVNLS